MTPKTSVTNICYLCHCNNNMDYRGNVILLAKYYIHECKFSSSNLIIFFMILAHKIQININKNKKEPWPK